MKACLLVTFVPCVFSSSSCFTKRTVPRGGRTVEETIVIERPITDTLKKIEFE